MRLQRLQALRRLMKDEGLGAYIITGTDPHQSESVADRWKTRAWISGFTGSAGTVVVTADTAALWTDSRYFLQAESQLDKGEFILFKSGLPGVPDYTGWLREALPPESSVGVSADEVSLRQFRELSQQLAGDRIELAACRDLLELIWEDRPQSGGRPIRELPVTLTGLEREEKIALLRKAAGKAGADTLLITSLDDIAWTLNLRGSDILYSPVFISYLCITPDRVHLFTLDRDLDLPGVEAEEYDLIEKRLPDLLAESRALYIDPEQVNMQLMQAVPETVRIVEGKTIPGYMKAVKNPTERTGMEEAHREDGAALAAFSCWFERAWDPQSEPLDECLLGDRLRAFREKSSRFIGESFAPIVGFRDHGAVVHYSADRDSAYRISGEGLLIIDSGGQYEGGTTDITRTFVLGEPTPQHRSDYTVVLKAHLALSRQQFPAGTYGYQLDGAARMKLWDAGLSYGHGTGHGVGHMLNVHEGPQNISAKPVTVALEPGMVLSNEPGVYRSGAYGIRIENLTAIRRNETTDFGEFFCFEDLTLFPYERKLIDMDLLDDRETAQIDRYHARVYRELKGMLTGEVLQWLKEKTLPLAGQRD